MCVKSINPSEGGIQNTAYIFLSELNSLKGH